MYRKKKEEQEIKYQKVKKRGEADRLVYYVLHTSLATLIFILIAMRLSFFSLRSNEISYLFSFDYLELIFIIFLWNIICSFLARIFGYYLLKSLYWRSTVKNIFELNSKGINRISFRYIIALFITSVLWTLGALLILSEQLFGSEDEVFALVLTYVIIKASVFIITKVIVDTRS